MWTTEGEFLFSNGSTSEFLSKRSSDLRAHVERIPKADFQGTEDENLIGDILSDIRVEPLIIDRDNIDLSPEDATLDASRDPNRAAYYFHPDEPTPMPATRYVFAIPYTGTSELWKRRPNRFTTVSPRGRVYGNDKGGHVELVFTEAKDASMENIQQKLKAELDLIETYLTPQRQEVEAFNSTLWDGISAAVAVRRKEFGFHQDLAKALGVRIKGNSTPTPVTSFRGPRPIVSRTEDIEKKWDVFVSYAGEDRDSAARPLAETLRARGLRVWFDKFELTLGDRLRRKIDEGLANSRFGIVLLSPSFFTKHWPQQELDGLAQREVNGQKVILPVWYNVDRGDVAAYSPTLADRIAVRWSDGIDSVVSEILAVVAPGN